MLPAIPSALVACSASSPPRRAAAAVAPKIPQIAVGWKPRLWKAPGVAMPILVTISFPATIAVSSSRPLAPRASASAAAAGTTTVLTCATESECVSSKSRPWQSIAFAKAAFGAGRRASSPITDASAVPPSSVIVSRPSPAIPSPCAASPQPITSSTCSFAASTTSAGTASRSSSSANRGEPFRCGRHHVLHSSSVPGKLRFACGAVRL